MHPWRTLERSAFPLTGICLTIAVAFIVAFVGLRLRHHEPARTSSAPAIPAPILVPRVIAASPVSPPAALAAPVAIKKKLRAKREPKESALARLQRTQLERAALPDLGE